MLERCYCPTLHKRVPTYKDCEVCERWHCFASFLEDLPLIEGYDYWLNHPNERVALDKDSKLTGNKIYCLELCSFLTNSSNVREAVIRNGNHIPKIPIISIDKESGEVKVYESQRSTPFNQSSISKCCRGVAVSAYGFYWFKIEDILKYHTEVPKSLTQDEVRELRQLLFNN